jgi:nicotinate-nucleotide adenylyltransferase
MRVALFGGTFDPPHCGHVGIARAAADAFALDTVLFAPTAQQPLKAEIEATSFPERMAMVELACTADPRFIPSTIDGPRADGGPNYTVDTLTALRNQMPTAMLFHLVGADSFLSLPHWRDPKRLLSLAEWIVARRPGYSLSDLSGMGLTGAERAHVHLLETVYVDVSATEVRQRLAAGESCQDLLSPEIVRYIREHRLYQSRDAAS